MQLQLREPSQNALDPRWTITQLPGSSVSATDDILMLTNHPTSAGYTNAQISDYDYNTFDFRWKPPLTMTVTAQAQAGSKMRGTAGFGFWNHPFSPDVEHFHRRLRLPQAIWFFFGAPPNAMNLAHGIPGWGWKAAMIDAGRPAALALAPLALPAFLLMQIPALYDALYPRIQRALAIGECLLDEALLRAQHTYGLEWRTDGARFSVDGNVIYETDFAPRGACGFVAWIDNQYAIVSPRGLVGSGVVPLPEAQALRIADIAIDMQG